MAAQEVVIKDIFEGADKIELLGKLPSMLWAYIERARSAVEHVDDPDLYAQSLKDTGNMLGVLGAAALHLGNDQLKTCIEGHAKIWELSAGGEMPHEEFKTTLVSELAALEKVAGPKPANPSEGFVDRKFFEKEMEKADDVKKGRSADLIVSVELLDEIRGYLTSEVITEGISSIMVIDDAGTLIVNVGEKIDLDAVSLAAVAAANFAATEKIARLIGESDFALLYYKGQSESFHFTRVGKGYIIVTIFTNSMTLGLLRLKIAKAAQVLKNKLPKGGGA
jgi:predicted regulator of Ras-like GTPase activity (Roadblock/LC7/MglB family)